MMEALMRQHDGTNGTDEALSTQLQTVKDDVKELGRLAGSSARQKLVEVKDRGERAYSVVRTGSRRAVKRRPLFAVTAAAGLGVLAGLLLGLRK